MALNNTNTFLMAAFLAATLSIGCAQGAPEDTLLAEEPLFAAAGDDQHAVGFEALTIELQEAQGFARVRVTGNVNGWPAVLNIDLDRNLLVVGQPLIVEGETWFDAADSAVFDQHPEQASAVLRAWVYGACADCPVAEAWQQMYGTLTIHSYSTGAIDGTLDLTLEGRIPAWAGASADLAVSISGPFATGTVVAPVVQPTPQPVAEPSTPVGSNTSGPATQEPAGPPAVTASDIYEATLLPGQGIDLSTGEVVNKANHANCDLWATEGHAFMKLSPGGTSPTVGRPLRWFSNSGGFMRTFNSLSEVPLQLPTAADGSKSIVKAKPWIGFVVQNNLSDSYTRVWISAGSADSLTIQYQTMVPAQ
ncbi:MAG: hypothetical protein ACI9WU_003362 [Myxococcota bacterium]|jgi:hypothetical protein